MKQPVPLQKQSRKARKQFHAAQRGSWNGVNPVSRAVPSGKLYDRGAFKRGE